MSWVNLTPHGGAFDSQCASIHSTNVCGMKKGKSMCTSACTEQSGERNVWLPCGGWRPGAPLWWEPRAASLAAPASEEAGPRSLVSALPHPGAGVVPDPWHLHCLFPEGQVLLQVPLAFLGPFQCQSHTQGGAPCGSGCCPGLHGNRGGVRAWEGERVTDPVAAPHSQGLLPRIWRG